MDGLGAGDVTVIRIVYRTGGPQPLGGFIPPNSHPASGFIECTTPYVVPVIRWVDHPSKIGRRGELQQNQPRRITEGQKPELSSDVSMGESLTPSHVASEI